MIDVGMRKNHRINSLWIKGEMTVALYRLRTSTLIQPTIQKNASVVDLNKMLGASRSSSSAAKSDFHDEKQAQSKMPLKARWNESVWDNIEALMTPMNVCVMVSLYLCLTLPHDSAQIAVYAATVCFSI
jgi:hypothetical protein